MDDRSTCAIRQDPPKDGPYSRAPNCPRLAASLVLAFLFAFFGPRALPLSPAAAIACDPTHHCYGIDYWNNSPKNTGAFAKLDAYALNVGDQCAQFATSELWEATNNTTAGRYWVETGMKHGRHNNGSCGNGIEWFWADMRPPCCSNYHEHYPSLNATTFQDYQTKIVYVCCDEWKLYRDGYQFATSTSNPCCSYAMEVGGEINTNSAYISAEALSLLWQPSVNASWNNGWGGIKVQDDAFEVSWISQGFDLYWYRCCVI
jgi:hypothetical protein